MSAPQHEGLVGLELQKLLCWHWPFRHSWGEMVTGLQCTVYRVQGIGYRVQGTVYSVQSTVYRVHCTGYKVQGTGYSVQGTGYIIQFTSYSTVYNIVIVQDTQRLPTCWEKKVNIYSI